jgi:hypothetical protein
MPPLKDVSPGPAMLIDAASVVDERGRIYGPMKPNMQRTADLWSPILGMKVTPAQVAMCLMAVKMARLIQSPDHLDSITDVAGYAAVYRECM